MLRWQGAKRSFVFLSTSCCISIDVTEHPGPASFTGWCLVPQRNNLRFRRGQKEHENHNTEFQRVCSSPSDVAAAMLIYISDRALSLLSVSLRHIKADRLVIWTKRSGNILILRGNIEILPVDRTTVSYEFLSQLVGEYILTNCHDVDISAALSMMPSTTST
jgi:hypothetical protein